MRDIKMKVDSRFRGNDGEEIFPSFRRKPESMSFSLAGGFTLVEVLVTVVVIAIGCLAALYMQAAAMGGAAQSDHLTVAASLGESEMERLKALSFGEATAEVEKYGLSRPADILSRRGECREKTDFCAPNPSYSGPWPYTRTVRYHRQLPTSLSHLAEVEVAWRDAQGSPHSLKYSAVLTNFSLD